ncbi:MAG TPA: ribonuclease activity regulator RraA [bacterium]|nr:ribonuclease activity regulator RraA [bacterium]
MHGPDFPRPRAETLAPLRRASTATLTTIFRRKKGITNIWMPLRPLFPGMRAVGPALTIRSVPGRDDLQPIAYAPGTLFPGHPDEAIEAVQPGDVVVLDGGGAANEGLFGDLLTLRIKMKGAAGIVSDMCVRDSPRLAEKGVPIFCRGCVSPGGSVFNVDYNVPIGCAGVLVCPGDIMAGDDDGVVVIPRAMVEDVVDEVLLHEDREEYIRLMLSRGAPLEGLYPMGPEMERRFLEWRRETHPRPDK